MSPEIEAELKAAEHGDASAQLNLGNMYTLGEGVPENDVEAYVWFSISAAGGLKEAKADRVKAKAKPTPERLIAAQKRATELFEQINANKAR